MLTVADNGKNMSHTTQPFRPLMLVTCAMSMWLAGCNEIPGLGPDARTVAKEQESKAVGSACRHAMRGIEDCYTLNPRAVKNHVFSGWKEMDEYMREHKIEGTPSVFTQKPAPSRPTREDDIETEYRSSRS